jgi:hypothetical protein
MRRSAGAISGSGVGRERAFLRSRWAALGAAISVVLGMGSIFSAGAVSAPTESTFTPITPCRLMDTRGATNIGPRATPLGSGEVYSALVWGTNGACSIPNTATGVTMNVTFDAPTASGYLSVFPSDQSWPGTSNLNWVAGQAPGPNSVTTRLSSTGRISILNSNGRVHVIIDIVGYYQSPTASSPPLAPSKNEVGSAVNTGWGRYSEMVRTQIVVPPGPDHRFMVSGESAATYSLGSGVARISATISINGFFLENPPDGPTHSLVTANHESSLPYSYVIQLGPGTHQLQLLAYPHTQVPAVSFLRQTIRVTDLGPV